MRKLYKGIVVLACAVLFYQCSKEQFIVKKGQVGLLTKKTTVKELSTIFKNDSIVTILSEGTKGDQYFQDDDEYRIYEKGGKHLLTIVPEQQLDSTSTIKSIEIFDARYKTEKGLHINSTFQQINANNAISNIETSFSSATLFIDELNATIAIDKEELGLKSYDNQKITIEQIPDLAKIKSFTIWFN